MSRILLILAPTIILIIGFVVGRRRALAKRITEPSCGACRYCVRGLESFTCPECGSDLREVGILTPGSAQPTPRWLRLLLWTLIIPMPAFMIGNLVTSALAPRETTGRQRRVVFTHIPGASRTVRITLAGTRTVWGRLAQPPSAPAPQSLTLRLENAFSITELNVSFSPDTYAFQAADKTLISRKGPLDAAVISEWLCANQMDEPEADETAGYLLAAVDDMKNPARAGTFLHFRDTQNQPRAVAHPAPPPFVTSRPTNITTYSPYAIAFLIWLIGLPFFLRKRPSHTPRRSEAKPGDRSHIRNLIVISKGNAHSD